MLSLAAVCTDYSTSGENVLCCAGARARVGLTGLTVAEYFRDEEGQDVLLFVDNIFRFTQACSEVSLRRRFLRSTRDSDFAYLRKVFTEK